jgi:hypothetical protein
MGARFNRPIGLSTQVARPTTPEENPDACRNVLAFVTVLEQTQERWRELAIAGAADSSEAGHKVRWLRKWVLLLLGGFAVLLFPWTAYLAYALPDRHLTPHWSIAWAGFDLMMAAAAIATVVAIVHRSRYLAMAASITGTFLLCDAWFDLITSRPGSELVESSLFAILGELPMAALCFWIARDAERVCAETNAYLARRRARSATAEPPVPST